MAVIETYEHVLFNVADGLADHYAEPTRQA